MNFTTSCKSAVAGAVVLAAMVAGAGPTISAEPKAECETLFVQSAKSVTMDDKTLTLKGVSPMVTFFCDRPTRHAGHLTMTEFLQSWDHGKDSFTADPPNAVISVLDGDTADDVVVELLDKPNVNGDELTYNISIIDGEPTKKKRRGLALHRPYRAAAFAAFFCRRCAAHDTACDQAVRIWSDVLVGRAASGRLLVICIQPHLATELAVGN